MKTFWKALLLLMLFAAVQPGPAVAQEVDVTVAVNYEAIPTTNKDRLRDLASDIRTYLSNYNWGGGSGEEKVKCTMNIFVQSVIGEDRYSAQVFVGSQRPIFKSAQSTAVTRFLDDVWEFTYIRDRPLNHNPYSYNDLTSFLDFYMYLLMGYDYDTYDRLGGTPIFQKAANIASLGRSSGQKGWQQSTSTYSRVQLIDELLNPAFEPVRSAVWMYHFTGLDSMAFDKERAWKNILSAVRMIGEVRKRADVRNLIIRSFFEAKAKELADLFIDYPDPSVYLLLVGVDPTHQKVYDEAHQRRKQD